MEEPFLWQKEELIAIKTPKVQREIEVIDGILKVGQDLGRRVWKQPLLSPRGWGLGFPELEEVTPAPPDGE